MPRNGGDFLDGRGFRHVSPGHEGVDEEALAGSRRVGGRFNPSSEFGAIYLSLEAETALAELERRAKRSGVEVDQLFPRVLLILEFGLQNVLDLTDPEIRDWWGLTPGDLVSDDHRPCQEVGRAARRAGYEAVLFPSAASQEGRNLAVFVDRLQPGSNLKIVETREL